MSLSTQRVDHPDLPAIPASLLFSAPTPPSPIRPVDELDDDQDPEPTSSQDPETSRSPWPRQPRPDAPDSTPTSTSTPSGDSLVTAKDAGIAIAGIVCVLTMGVSWLVMARTRGAASLRQPTKQQARDIAQPLARIAARHVDASLLHPDLGDALMAISATGAYIGDGPLRSRPTSTDDDQEA
jgi:hypothetical protein